MKIFTLIFCFFCVSLFISCSNDDTELPPLMQEQENFDLEANIILYGNSLALFNQDQTFLNNRVCYTFNYPYSVSDGDTETIINSAEDFIIFLESLESPQSFFYVYPITVTLADGTEVVLNNDLDFFALLQFCESQNPSDSACFEIQFPVAVIDSMSNEFVVENELALNSLENIEGFVYPIVILQDGQTINVENDLQFDQLYNDCNNISCSGCDFSDCFRVQYPVRLLRETGTVITLNSDEELAAYVNGLPQNTSFTFVYDVAVITADNTTVTIRSDEDFLQLIATCN